MISFYKRTLADFNTAKTGSTLVPDGIYFITDTGEIYVASANNTAVKYAQNQLKIVSSSSWPEAADAEAGVLYIDEKGYQKVKSGSTWITVNIPSVDSIDSANYETISGQVPTVAAVSSYVAGVQATASGLEARIKNSITDDTPTSALITAQGIASFVAGKANTAKSEAIADALSSYVSTIAFSNETGKLTQTISGEVRDVATVNGLLSGATYEAGTLSLGIRGQSAITLNLPAEQFLSAVKYCTVTAGMLTGGIPSGDAAGFANDNVPAATFTDVQEGTEGILFQFAKNTDSDAEIEEFTYTFVSCSSLIKPYSAGDKATDTPVTIVVDADTRKITATFSKDTTLKYTEGVLGVDSAVVSAAIQDALVDYVEANADSIPSSHISGLQDYLTSKFALELDKSVWDAALSTETASGSFANADTMATEKSVKAYVSGFVADELASFLTSLSMSQYAKKVGTGHEKEIAYFDASGDLLSSGIKVGAKDATAFGSETEVALESAITAYIAAQVSALRGGDEGALSGKIDKVTGATGKIGKFTATGNLESTGFEIGATTSGEFGSETELATESAVSGFVASEIATALKFN